MENICESQKRYKPVRINPNHLLSSILNQDSSCIRCFLLVCSYMKSCTCFFTCETIVGFHIRKIDVRFTCETPYKNGSQHFSG